MVRDIVGLGIVALVYLCFIIVIFAPTIYAAWLYLVTRKFTTKRKGMARLLLYTFVINAIIAYFLAHLAFNYFLGTKTEERESSVTATMQSAVASQKKFFASHGRYYNVGPVRGPYQDEHGLNVEKDVILFITPTWDKQLQRDNFEAYAVHVWGKTPLESTNDGKLKKLPADSEESIQIRSKLLNSVK